MASEDNFLRLDTNNYDDEILYRLDNDMIDIMDLYQLLQENYIDKDTFKVVTTRHIQNKLQGLSR